jgi:hypothetical protein
MCSRHRTHTVPRYGIPILGQCVRRSHPNAHDGNAISGVIFRRIQRLEVVNGSQLYFSLVSPCSKRIQPSARRCDHVPRARAGARVREIPTPLYADRAGATTRDRCRRLSRADGWALWPRRQQPLRCASASSRVRHVAIDRNVPSC